MSLSPAGNARTTDGFHGLVRPRTRTLGARCQACSLPVAPHHSHELMSATTWLLRHPLRRRGARFFTLTWNQLDSPSTSLWGLHVLVAKRSPRLGSPNLLVLQTSFKTKFEQPALLNQSLEKIASTTFALLWLAQKSASAPSTTWTSRSPHVSARKIMGL